MKSSYALLIAATLVATSATALAPTKLKMNVKKGDSHTMSVKFDVDFGGQALTYSDTRKLTITEVKADGTILLTENVTESSINMSGDIQPAGMDGESAYTYKSTGEIASLTTPNSTPDDYRFANLTNIIWPDKEVEVGSKWDKTLEASSDKSTPKTTYKYEILAEEAVNSKDAFKVKFSVTEDSGDTPASANGTLWIQKSTGWILKGEGETKNMPAGGMVLNAKFVISSK